MKSLVVFYSRTGNTRKVAEEVAGDIKADVDEIIDNKNRKGIIGFLIGCIDAKFKKLTDITYKKDSSKYDLTVIGTPVWALTMTPAIRTYLAKNNFKKVAFFCTYGGNDGKTFLEMEKLSKKAVGVLGLKSRDISKEESKEKIKEFCNKIKSIL